MRGRGRIVKVTSAVVLTLAATVVAVSGPVAGAAPVRRPLHAQVPVTAGVVEAPFSVDYFGLVAPLGGPRPEEQGRAPFGEVRFRHGRRWSAWRPLAQDGAQAEDAFTAGLVYAHGADAYQVRDLPAALRRARASVINTTDGPVVGHEPRGAAAQAASPCRSRADWNADESITAWTRGTDVPAFAPVQVLTVHHTAGSNDPNQNFADTVRAIEVYHVRSNGWSDIGYQYLLDPSGILYEGRYSGHTSRSCLTGGGDGSDFAHRSTDDAVVTGAHVAGYNTGNLGISLLGCFDDQPACSPGTYGAGDTSPKTPAVAGLRDVLARLADRHGLNPTGSVNYSNGTNSKTSPTISGHRDWEATACPGGNLYSQLPATRAAVGVALTPSQLSATESSGGVNLAWQGAGWPGVPEQTRYRIVRDDGTTWTVGGRTYTDATAPHGRTVTYDVTAVATDGAASSNAARVAITTSASDVGFTLAVDPSSDSTTAGSTRTANVVITSTGSSGPVELRADVDRTGAGVTVALDATTVTAGGSTTLRVTASPASSGTYTVTVTGTTTSGSRQASYVLSVVNRDPVVSMSSSCSGGRCNLAATATDPDGGALTLAWAMPGGTPSSAGNTAQTSVAYSTSGTYTATVRATDPAARTGSAARQITCAWSGKGKSRTLICQSA